MKKALFLTVVCLFFALPDNLPAFCTHRGQPVECPAGVPDGSNSSHFDPQGNVVFPGTGGKTVTVPPSGIVPVSQTKPPPVITPVPPTKPPTEITGEKPPEKTPEKKPVRNDTTVVPPHPPDIRIPVRRDNPPPHIPPEEPVEKPVSIYPKKTPAKCPQRDKGCVALIIDISKAVWNELDYASIARDLQALKCDVDYVETHFKQVPARSFLVGVKVPFTDMEVYKTQKTYRQEELRINKHNDAQWTYIREHLQDHRKKVAETGPELAIEMVIGHGGCGSGLTENECEGKGDYRWDGNACGVWGASFYTNDSLDRAEFHAGNYKAANKNVCDWVVIDSSCFSGFTAKAVDELNNLQTARCDRAPADACANHAAWENDTALTTVSPGKLSKWSDARRLKGYIREILEEEAFLLKRNGSVYYPRIAQKLRSEGYTEKGCYSDRGYMMDVPPPPDHVRQGY